MGVHEGHRARLKRRFEAEGLDGFQPHEALELILFQTVARRDVNPLAHELIDRFGSLHGVLSAGEDALNAHPGVGARTAALLSSLPAFFEACRAQGPEDAPVLKNLSAARAYCGRLIKMDAGDRLWLMHLGAGGSLLLTESLPAPGGYPRAREVVERALKSRAQALVVAAARAGAAAAPGDRNFAGALGELLSMIGVTLVDGLLLDGDRFTSFRRQGYLAAPLREDHSAPRLMEARWLWDGEEAGKTPGETPGPLSPDPIRPRWIP